MMPLNPTYRTRYSTLGVVTETGVPLTKFGPCTKVSPGQRNSSISEPPIGHSWLPPGSASPRARSLARFADERCSVGPERVVSIDDLKINRWTTRPSAGRLPLPDGMATKDETQLVVRKQRSERPKGQALLDSASGSRHERNAGRSNRGDCARHQFRGRLSVLAEGCRRRSEDRFRTLAAGTSHAARGCAGQV